jgi:hypothetical protein
MTDPSRDDELQALWQSQSRSEPAISLDEVRGRASRLERIVVRRNRREYVAAAIVVAFFGAMAWFGGSVTIRVGAALTVAAAIVIAYQLHRRGSVTPLPADLALQSALDFHRAQLVRQRDLVRTAWLWGLMPLAPGGILVIVGQAILYHRSSPIVAAGILIAVCTAIFGGVHAVNRRAAARIQQRLDRLNENN